MAIGDGEIIMGKLAVGEHVLFQKFAGAEVKLDDGDYIILSESDILGRIVEVEQITHGAA